MENKPLNLIRNSGPEIVLGLVVLLGAVSLWQWWDTAQHLRDEARESSRIYGRIISALNDTAPGASTEALLELAADVTQTGLPLIVTDSLGRVAATANLPFDPAQEPDRMRGLIRSLEQKDQVVSVSGTGSIHFGSLPTESRLGWITILQFAVLLAAVGVAVWAYRTMVNRDRERLWIAMARESAHQLGTPLMSAEAWIERLKEGRTDSQEVAQHLEADLDRLQRVAQRFERIGRPARRDKVALGALVERVAAYFEPRLPRRANQVKICVDAPAAGPFLRGDPVLLEWAVESLVRNSIDALSGKGGEITVSLAAETEQVRLRVADDGPGVDPHLRSKIFEPGVSSKPGGWGIGLPLARRIVEDVHGGHLTLESSSQGALFVAALPIEDDEA